MMIDLSFADSNMRLAQSIEGLQLARVAKLFLCVSIMITPLVVCAQTTQIVPVPRPVQLGPFAAHLQEVQRLIHAPEARTTFNVNGETFTVAVLDTGLNASHQDFSSGANRVVAQRNFTNDNNKNPLDARDGNGHGTHVGGIIVANKIHVGIAPQARIVPLKVLDNTGSGSFESIQKALGWVKDHFIEFNISVVSMSLGDNRNLKGVEEPNDPIRASIRELAALNIPVVIAAGNGFFQNNSEQGMCYPAIYPEAISVGAVFDDEMKIPISWADGATVISAVQDQLTPFSQRLSPDDGIGGCQTDIFAPGSRVTSTGIDSNVGSSVQDGTSQACPVISGVILLMQQYYKRLTSGPNTPGILPSVSDIKKWLRVGSVAIEDSCPSSMNICDNVVHTHKTFRRIDVVKALTAISEDLKGNVLSEKVPIHMLKSVTQLRLEQQHSIRLHK